VVPAGRRWVVRDIDVLHDLGVAGGFLAGADGYWFWNCQWDGSVAQGAWNGWRGRQVIAAGGTLTIYSDAPAAAHVSGYDLLDL
jgi:hypothetical protein